MAFRGLTEPGTAKPPKSAQFGQFWRFGHAWLGQPSEGHENSNFLGINSWSTYKKVSKNAKFVTVVFYQHYYGLSNKVNYISLHFYFLTHFASYLNVLEVGGNIKSIMFLPKPIQITFSRGPSSNFFEMSKNILYDTLSGIVTTRF